MKRNIIAIAFLFLALSFFSPAKSFALMADTGAAELARLDSARLAKEAKVIVQGEVKSVKSYKGINDIIYTRTSFSVSDVFKGKIAKKNITVEYRGGEIEDEPRLERGEQALLFLTNSFWRKNVYYIVGGISGKYTVNNISQEKQTLDELLSEIENAE